MPRRTLRRFLPHPQDLLARRSLRPLAKLLHDPNLFHLGRRPVALAIAVGVFVGLQPVPMHMLIAAVAALRLRCNLTLAVLSVLVSNPLTLPPILYFEYLAGARLLGMPAPAAVTQFDTDALGAGLSAIWQPLLLGSISSGLVLGAACWVATRVAWRVAVQIKWRARRHRRAHS